MGKTKVLTNQFSQRGESSTVGGKAIQIVESTEYFGRVLTFTEVHDTEIEHRIGKTWKKFMSLKRDLCSKHYPLNQRLKLFSATVTATLLYGSGDWYWAPDGQRRIGRLRWRWEDDLNAF